MADPMTVGACVSLFLGMASEAAVKGVIGEAAKDAYRKLKEKVAQWAAGDVQALEQNPSSTARRAVVAEVVDQLPDADKLSVKALADALAQSLKEAAAAGPIGIDIGRLEAARVDLERIAVQEGTGFRAEEVKTPGDFKASDLSVGTQPGKKQQ